MIITVSMTLYVTQFNEYSCLFIEQQQGGGMSSVQPAGAGPRKARETQGVRTEDGQRTKMMNGEGDEARK